MILTIVIIFFVQTVAGGKIFDEAGNPPDLTQYYKVLRYCGLSDWQKPHKVAGDAPNA